MSVPFLLLLATCKPEIFASCCGSYLGLFSCPLGVSFARFVECGVIPSCVCLLVWEGSKVVLRDLDVLGGWEMGMEQERKERGWKEGRERSCVDEGGIPSLMAS